MNSNKDEAIAETDTTQSKWLQKPRSTAGLLLEILAVLLALAYLVIIVKKKAGIY